MEFLIVMVGLLVVMYVVMIRPQRQRQQVQQAMIDGCGIGDDILTTGGIYGTVVEAEGDDLVVELAEGMTVHMTRRGIAAVLPPEAEEAEEAEEELGVDGDGDGVQSQRAEADEASVTAEEEGVTGEATAEEAVPDRK